MTKQSTEVVTPHTALDRLLASPRIYCVGDIDGFYPLQPAYSTAPHQGNETGIKGTMVTRFAKDMDMRMMTNWTSQLFNLDLCLTLLQEQELGAQEGEQSHSPNL